MKTKKLPAALTLALSLCLLLFGCNINVDVKPQDSFSPDSIPAYSGSPYVAVNGNEPFFDESESSTVSFERYGELDYLGRCSEAFACIGQDLMPSSPRESISKIKPTGWQTAEYSFVDGKHLYNRCHLIGFQLSGENANEKNLITGTRYLNVEGMLPFENMTADYVKETENHVLYRVTPIFTDDNLVADGVLMEAKSVEDGGEGICFNVYAYNVQPGVIINYATGDSTADETIYDNETKYILNTNTKKFHDPSCKLSNDIKKSNRQVYYGSREALIMQGYEPCGSCKP